MTTDHERREGQWPVQPINDPRNADPLYFSEFDLSAAAMDGPNTHKPEAPFHSWTVLTADDADSHRHWFHVPTSAIKDPERRSTPILTFCAGVIVGIVVAMLIIVFTPPVLAAPLSVQPSVEDAGRSEAPLLSMDGGSALSPGTDAEAVPGGYQESDGGGVSSDDILQGVASYYLDPRDPNGLYAAVPTWTFGDEPYLATVCRPENGACVTVTVRDFCGCPDRVIDLSRDAFAKLATLARGLIEVTVTSGTTVVLPATDTP
jgi:hypothetical protein